jgi:hypothetical protein
MAYVAVLSLCGACVSVAELVGYVRDVVPDGDEQRAVRASQ